MALTITNQKREFEWDGQVLPDPNQSWSQTQVLDHYAAVHPELLNANIVGPTVKDGVVKYEFKNNLGTKG